MNEENREDETSEINSTDFITINEEINQPITATEIMSIIKNLKNNKSNGIDSILNEHLKHTCNFMLPMYNFLT